MHRLPTHDEVMSLSREKRFNMIETTRPEKAQNIPAAVIPAMIVKMSWEAVHGKCPWLTPNVRF